MSKLRLRITVRGPAQAAGARLANNTYIYSIVNPRLTSCRITFSDGTGQFADYQPSNPHYDQAGTYYRMRSPVARATFLHRLNTASGNGSLTISLSFRVAYLSFFQLLLEQWAYAVADRHNFADPAGGGGPILASVTRTQTDPMDPDPGDEDWDLQFHGGHTDLNNAPATLANSVAVGASTTDVTVLVNLATIGLNPAQRMGVMQALVASDWSELWERSDPDDPQPVQASWTANIESYMLRYISLTRGRTLIDGARALGLQARQIASANGGLNDTQRQHATVDAIRAEVDRFMVTTNPWGDDTNGGAYPTATHIILAGIYARDAATPILIEREMENRNLLTATQGHEMVAQMGMGNCAEHADIVFRIIRALMIADGTTAALLRVVIRSGYAHIDHAFVVGGEYPVEIIDAKCHSGAHPVRARDSRREVWDAYPSLLAAGGAPGREGWICDPYLAVGEIDDTFTDLCNVALGDDRTYQWLNWRNEVHPAPGVAIATRRDHDNHTHPTHVHIHSFCTRAPTITSIVRTTGTTLGGTDITINGTHLESRARVRFDNNDAVYRGAQSGASLVRRLPPHVAGLVNVNVRNTDNQQITAPNAFTYIVPPTVQSILPVSGPANVQTPLVITGTDFVAGGQLAVSFGVTAAAAFAHVNGTTIHATAPALGAGAVNVVVRNNDGQLSTQVVQYTYILAPVVQNILPVAGPAGAQTQIVITGLNFVAGGQLAVSFGATPAHAFQFVNGTTINATSPALGPGAVNVVVTNNDGQVSTQVVAFTFNAVPVVVVGDGRGRKRKHG